MNKYISQRIFRIGIIKGLILSFFITILFATAVSDANGNDVADNFRLTDKERIWLNNHSNPKIGVWVNAPPYAFPDSNGIPQGIFPDYVKEIESHLNISLQIISLPSFAAAWEKAMNNELDLLVAVTPSKRHLKHMNLSQTYHVVPVVLVTRSDMPFVSSIKEFNGKKVVVGKGHVTEQWIKRDFPGIQLIPSENYEKGLRLVSEGRADAYAGAMAALTWQINKFRITNLKIAGKTPYEYKLSIAARKDWPEFIPIVNKALNLIKGQKQDEIYNRWVTVRFEEGVDWRFIWKIIGSIIAVSVVIFTIIFIWNRRLQRLILEKEKAENKLKQSENLFRSVIEKSPIAMIVSMGVDEKVVKLNSKFAELFGYTIADIPNVAAWWPLAYPDKTYREKIKRNWTKAIEKAIARQSEVEPFEVSVSCQDGSTKDVIIEAASIGETNLVTFVDVTERKKAEKALQESEERFRTAGKVAYDLIYEWDTATDSIEWFGNIDGLLGYEEGQISKNINGWIELIHPDDKYHLENAVELHRTSKKAIHYEYRVKHKDGTYRYWNDNAHPILDEKGRPSKWIGVCTDVTERRKAVEALSESEEKYRMLVETANDGIFIAQDGVIKFPNPKTTEITGYTADELSQMPFANILQSEYRDLVVERHLKRLNGEKQPSSYSFKIVNKDGEELWVQLNTELINWEDRPATINVIRDITEQRELEAQLRHAHKMEAIGNLAGGIAHDFNNILSSIIGFTELALDETQKGSVIEDSLQEVYSAGKRAKDLVKQILAFARQSEEKRSPIQLATVTKEVLKFIRSTIPTSIEIEQDIISESWIMGSATQMHQVLMNLCTNASHAMEDSGGVLSLKMNDVSIDRRNSLSDIRHGDYIKIQVSDTGVGISPDIMDSIFEPYFTTKGPGEGTGMGLAMVQGVIESYNGKITVDSQLGIGTTFTIYLPITKRRSAQREYVPEQLPTGTERILFVDDEAPIAKMGSQILDRLGYTVTTRTSSAEALELFQTKPNDFDLVVTDMTMPNLTGDKLAIELMKIRPDIPVVLCTGYSKKISDETASEIGIKAFAYKPVVKADLAKTVRKVLDEAKG